jgi:hypothetical protein
MVAQAAISTSSAARGAALISASKGGLRSRERPVISRYQDVNRGLLVRKSGDRLYGDPTPCGPGPRPASRSKWWRCAQSVSHSPALVCKRPGRGGRWWLFRAHGAFAWVPVLSPFRSSRNVALCDFQSGTTVIVVPFLGDKNRPIEISGAFLAGMKDIEKANT